MFFGTSILKQDLSDPEWEAILSSASRLPKLVPGAVLVGGTASAQCAAHRFSFDHDHVLVDLKRRFNAVLADLESVSGWKTARIRRPVLILGSLDGIEAGVRQLIRSRPLETQRLRIGDQEVKVPTFEEILRIKGFLIIRRNATRDYVDFAALGESLGPEGACLAFQPFDEYYPQDNGESALQQLIKQLGSATPYDLAKIDLASFKGLARRWHTWRTVSDKCAEIGILLMKNAADKQSAP